MLIIPSAKACLPPPLSLCVCVCVWVFNPFGVTDEISAGNSERWEEYDRLVNLTDGRKMPRGLGNSSIKSANATGRQRREES